MTKPTSEVKNRWNAKSYDRIMFVVKQAKDPSKSMKAQIKQRAKELDMSVNAYLTSLVENDLSRK